VGGKSYDVLHTREIKSDIILSGSTPPSPAVLRCRSPIDALRGQQEQNCEQRDHRKIDPEITSWAEAFPRLDDTFLSWPEEIARNTGVVFCGEDYSRV
jgi:hypothetical protein